MFRSKMRGYSVLALITFCLLAAAACAQEAQAERPAPLHILAEEAPQAVLHEPYELRVSSEGGTTPITWRVEQGELPPGVDLDQNSGEISGKPEDAGEFHFTLTATDSGQPAQSKSREFTVRVVAPLSIEWEQAPELAEDGIKGSVTVANATGDAYDLTVIIVAVNEIGKAFALGYQHFNLQQDTSQVIQFGASLPAGDYIVHADAVAEIASKDLIRRARLETPAPLSKR